MTEQTKQNIINNVIENTLTVYFADGTPAITESNIASESMTFTQSICDEAKLKFGGCIAAEFSIDVLNTLSRTFTLNDLVGKDIYAVLTMEYIDITQIYPSATLCPASTLLPGAKIKSIDFTIFRGRIASAKLDQNNPQKRHVIAYDAFADLYSLDYTNILYNIWNNPQTINSILSSLNLYILRFYPVPINTSKYLKYINDRMNKYTVQNNEWLKSNSKISCGQALNYICEILGCFGVVDYTSNQQQAQINILDLQKSECETYDFYQNLNVEEYQSKGYQYISVSNKNTDRSLKITSNDYTSDSITIDSNKSYDMTDNIFLYQGSDVSMPVAGTNAVYIILSGGTADKLALCNYTPFSATVDGRPWMNAGDKIKINSYKTDVYGNYVLDSDGNRVVITVESYILSRTLTGIKSLTDKITAKGAN